MRQFIQIISWRGGQGSLPRREDIWGKRIDVLWGDGDELREFSFIEDLVKIVFSLTFNDYDGVVNVASGRSHTVKEIIAHLSGLSGREAKVNTKPRTKRKVDNGFINDKLLELLPGLTFVDLRTGIKRAYEAELRSIGLHGVGV